MSTLPPEQKPSIADHLKQRELQNLENSINEISNLVNYNDDTIVRIPEHVFKEYWLPVFTGDAVSDERKRNYTLEGWCMVAGGAYVIDGVTHQRTEGAFASVHVINDANQIIFTVPPVLNRDSINPVRPNRVNSIYDEIKHIQQMASNNPIAANNYRNKFYDNRARGLVKHKNLLDFLNAWNKIFEFYGRPIIDINRKSEVVETSFNNDELDYD